MPQTRCHGPDGEQPAGCPLEVGGRVALTAPPRQQYGVVAAPSQLGAMTEGNRERTAVGIVVVDESHDVQNSHGRRLPGPQSGPSGLRGVEVLDLA